MLWSVAGLWGGIPILNSAWRKASLRRCHLRKIKGDEEASFIALWENSISGGRMFPGKGNDKCREPEVEACLKCLRRPAQYEQDTWGESRRK